MKHIYIHVPFCRRRCIYCDFSVAVRREVPAERFVRAIMTEYEARRAAGDWGDTPLETIYFGGGTPSLLPAQQLGELLSFLIENEQSSNEFPEITLEANPEDVTETAARAWHDAGFNRVSLGVQSFDERVLEWMHRTHTAERSVAALRALRNAGFESISLDLMSGLPKHLGRDLSNDLTRVLRLEPDHVSVYGLTVELRTTLARRVDTGRESPTSDDVFAGDFMRAHEVLSGAGYEHYEVSNYARDGKRSRHNAAYWDGSTYGGLGPSAHGFDEVERRWNIAPWARYEGMISEVGAAVGGREVLTADQRKLERLYLGARVADGLTSAEISHLDQSIVSKAEENGWAETVGNRWRLTPAGWLRLDEIVAGLTTSPEGG